MKHDAADICLSRCLRQTKRKEIPLTFGSLSEWLFKQVMDKSKGVKRVDVVFDSYTSDHHFCHDVGLWTLAVKTQIVFDL